LIRAYAFALASDKLRKAQHHIGKRCVFLMGSLVRTALDVAIKQACGFSPNIQQTAQKNYIDAVKLIKEFGFTCSAGDDIAIKKDITQFLKVPESTLNSFLRKHKNDIQPIQLDAATIRSFGGKASRMNFCHFDQREKSIAAPRFLPLVEMTSVQDNLFKSSIFCHSSHSEESCRF
jgi:hypothetical protein